MVLLVLLGRITKVFQVELQTSLAPLAWQMIFSFLLFLLLPPFHMHSRFLVSVSSPQHSQRCLPCSKCPPGGGLCPRCLLAARCVLAGGAPCSKGGEEALLSLHTQISNFLTRQAVTPVLLHCLPAETNSLDYCVLSGRRGKNISSLWFGSYSFYNSNSSR